MGKLPPPLFHQLLPHSAAINAYYCRALKPKCHDVITRFCVVVIDSFVFSFYGDRGQCASYFSGQTIIEHSIGHSGVPSLITWLYANALDCKYQAMPMPTLIFTASAMGALWLVEGSNQPGTLTKIIVFSFIEFRYLVYRARASSAERATNRRPR